MGMTWKQVAENIITAMPAICEAVPQKVRPFSCCHAAPLLSFIPSRKIHTFT